MSIADVNVKIPMDYQTFGTVIRTVGRVVRSASHIIKIQ
jgi:hypothetical protein